MKVEVYTDGSATVREKPGGWAYVLVADDKKKAECGGHMQNASNNDAEMEAAIQGLAAALKWINAEASLVPNIEVSLVSDSQLILGWASGLYRFKQHSKLDKYKQLRALVQRMNVQTRWVQGHSGDEHNERCDKLANEARLSINREIDRKEAIAEGRTLVGTKKSGIMCFWYKDTLKIVDFETNIVENYDRSIHGPRGSAIEIREDRSR